MPLAGLFALVLSPSAVAQAGSFVISQHGQPVGTASFRFTATPEGYDSTALVRIAMPGLDYALSKTELLTPANRLRHVQVSATLNNAAVNVVAAPDATQILINISASGRASTTRLEPHPGAVFLADFDPGAKYHIPGNVPYMRYFLARVYQFQFYRAMCQAAGYKGPLNRCSVYGSKEAGAKLNAMLELGRSKPWPEALKAMTGTDKADASAIIEYFQPLLDWLKEQNKGEKEGWTLPADPLK